MTPSRHRAIDSCLGAIIVLAGLAGAAGCGEYRVDLGSTVPDEPICPFGNGQAPSSLSFVDGSGAQFTLPVTGSRILGQLLVVHGQLSNFGDGNLTVRAWLSGAGPYRCEDPSTAGRTRIVGFGSQIAGVGSPPVGWTLDTLSAGTCSISIKHLPGADGSTVEGSFVASGGGRGPFWGTFIADNPYCQ